MLCGMKQIVSGVVAAIVAALAVSCQTATKSGAIAEVPKLGDSVPRELEGLHNVVAFHAAVFSGSSPLGEAGFATLAAMNVKTVISVDGAAPNVVAAHKHGIRYVHLPIGYDGFDSHRRIELARAARDGLTRGSVYVHCQHGKHRSATAAASIAQCLGWMSKEEGHARMKVSGTAESYAGLYRCAAEAGVLSDEEIESVSGEFVEVQAPRGFLMSMVEIDEVMGHLHAIEKAGWNVPAEQPDLVPAAQAGRLADLFRDLQKDDRAMRNPLDFLEQLKTEEKRAKRLEEMLVAGEAGKELSLELLGLGKSCKECHAKYRD